MGEQGKLFALAADCQSPQRRGAKQTPKLHRMYMEGKHYDSGMAIDLSYEMDVYPEPMSTMHGLSYPEDTPTNFDEYQELSTTRQDTEDEYSPGGDVSAMDTPYEEVPPYADELAESPSGGGLEEAMVEDWEEEGVDDPSTAQAVEDIDAAEAPPATTSTPMVDESIEPSGEKTKSSGALSDVEFAQDLAAILKGEKAYDPGSKKVVKKASQTTPDPVPVDPTPPKVAPPEQTTKDQEPFKDEHAIFEKISQSMKHANAYDLGAIALEERFDNFDKEMEQKEIQSIATEAGKASTAMESPVISPEDLEAEEQRAVDLDIAQSKEIEDATVLEEGLSEDYAEEQALAESFSTEKPLDFTNGGMSIGPDSLEEADIILSTTSDPEISKRIRTITHSTFSHAGVYVGGPGDGNVIEAIEDPGVVERSLETAMKDDTVTVALRHADMTPDKAEKIVKFLKAKRGPKGAAKFDKWAVIKNLPIQLITSYCCKISPKLRDKCRNFAGKIFMGTESNDEFYCSELIFEAFRAAGLSLSKTEPHWTSPEDLVQLGFNGTLRYVGHLKLTT